VGDDDDAIAQRIAGQAADLDVAVSIARGPQLEGRLTDQLAAADGLAKERGARVVVWFELDARAPGAVLVFVSEPASGRLLVRRVGGEEGSTPTSATFEAAALVVRSALRALAAGGVIGVERDEVLRERGAQPAAPVPMRKSAAPRPETPPAPLRSREPPPEKAPTESPGEGLSWLGGVGFQIAADGAAEAGALSIVGHGGLMLRPLELGVIASAGLPSASKDPFASVALSRYSAAATAAWQALRGPTLDGLLTARLGVLLFVRSTEDARPRVVAAPTRTSVSVLLGPELALRWRPTGGGWGLLGGGGVDWVPGAPEIGYEVEGAFQSALGIWRFQPHGRVAFELISR
jgi:hypothetical protein